jgi:hypothetical protein
VQLEGRVEPLERLGKSAADVAAGVRQVEAEAAAVAGAEIGRRNVDTEMGWVGDFDDKELKPGRSTVGQPESASRK